MNKEKYCSSCRTYKNLIGGKLINTANKNVKRWKCYLCTLQTKLKKTSEK